MSHKGYDSNGLPKSVTIENHRGDVLSKDRQGNQLWVDKGSYLKNPNDIIGDGQNRQDCCQTAQAQFDSCNQSQGISPSSQCSSPGCICTSFPIFMQDYQTGGGEWSWTWSEEAQEYIWTSNEIVVGSQQMYQCHCHPSPETGYMLAACCPSGISERFGPPPSPGGGRGGWRRGGRIGRRR